MSHGHSPLGVHGRVRHLPFIARARLEPPEHVDAGSRHLAPYGGGRPQSQCVSDPPRRVAAPPPPRGPSSWPFPQAPTCPAYGGSSRAPSLLSFASPRAQGGGDDCSRYAGEERGIEVKDEYDNGPTFSVRVATDPGLDLLFPGAANGSKVQIDRDQRVEGTNFRDLDVEVRLHRTLQPQGLKQTSLLGRIFQT